MSGESVTFQSSWILDVADQQWFDVTYVAEISSVVCISHSGNISYIQEDLVQKYYSREVKQNSFIEGGISTAKWNQDQSSLLMITESSMLVLMSNTFAVMAQVPLVERVPASPTCISWRADGQYFVVMSKDVFEANTRVRIYNRNLDVVGICRNLGDDEASVMRGLGLVTALAGNGSYVAVCKHRIKGKQQVVLLDGTGLRREDFDIQLPPVPAGFLEWEVVHLEWDVPCLLLAVGLRCKPLPPVEGAPPPPVTSAHTAIPCILQLYYRNTYYWYLKQQWEGDRLRFLGFDSESINRLFMSQLITKEDKIAIPALRIVEIGWDLNSCISVTSAVNLTPALGNGKVVARKPTKEGVTPRSTQEIPTEIIKSSSPTNSTTSSAAGVSLFQQVVAEPQDSRKLTEEERLKRCRERNKIDARNTRNRKRVQLEEMQLKVSELLEEKNRLSALKPPPQDNDIASILMSLSSNNNSNDGVHIHNNGSNGNGHKYSTFEASNQSDEKEASILNQFRNSGVNDLDDDDGDDDGDNDDNESTNNDDEDGTGKSNKKIKMEYTTTDPEARRKERNRIHAQKARLRKKTLLRDMKLMITNLESEILSMKNGGYGSSSTSSSTVPTVAF